MADLGIEVDVSMLNDAGADDLLATDDATGALSLDGADGTGLMSALGGSLDSNVVSEFSHQLDSRRINKLEQYMPYAKELTESREQLLLNLKNNLCRVLLEQGDELTNWIHAFNS